MLTLRSMDAADEEPSAEVVAMEVGTWLEVKVRAPEDTMEDSTEVAATEDMTEVATVAVDDAAELKTEDKGVAVDDGAALEDPSVVPDLEIVIEELPLPEMPSVAII